ncbi:MAG: hypothetical protein AAGA10_04150 [Bacteroidota bacterium]
MNKVGVLYGSIFLLTGYVLLEQFFDPYWAGFDLVVQRHQDMLNHTAKFYNPWQYRIFSTYLVEAFLNIWRTLPFQEMATPNFLGEKGIQLSTHLPFILVKAGLLFLFFRLSVSYLDQMGIHSLRLKILGIWLLSFYLYPAQFSADLSLDVYIEAIFYLLAMISLLNNSWAWIPLITLFAAFNRESSGFIPLLILVFHFSPFSRQNLPGTFLGNIFTSITLKEKSIQTFVLSCIIYIGVFIGLRIYFGFPAPQTVYGNHSFLDFFSWNLMQPTTYYQWIRSFTLLPFFALWFYPKWPTFLKMGFWVMVPLWLVIHFGHGIVRETRLFLVPTSLFLIPGILWGISSSKYPEPANPAS